MHNPIDFIIEVFSPRRALRRATDRQLLKRYYEAARPSPTRRPIQDGGSGDNVAFAAAHNLRKQARYLDENHDLARGVLHDLVNGIVGTGITSQPMLRTRRGKLAKKANQIIRRKHREWQRRPEVTREMNWVMAQRLACRTWLRDGEIFAQKVTGLRADIQYSSDVPFLLELLESEMVPMDYVAQNRDDTILGIDRDAWGAAKNYKVYKTHPADMFRPQRQELKDVPASRMIHLKFSDRVSQTRGVSLFAPIMIRLDDLKEYEESERIAARVAAAFTGYIKRPDFAANTNVDTSTGRRMFEMSPGLIFDGLGPGEDVGMIKSDRPNTGLESFRQGQIRALTSGTGASNANVSKDFSGTYSSQRQELVVQTVSYGALRNEFVTKFVDDSWRTFIDMLILTGALDGVAFDRDTRYEVEHRGAPMPWIDPLKEAKADEVAVANGFKSQAQVIKDRSGNPDDVIDQVEAEREAHKEKGLTFKYYAGQGTEKSAEGGANAADTPES